MCEENALSSASIGCEVFARRATTVNSCTSTTWQKCPNATSIHDLVDQPSVFDWTRLLLGRCSKLLSQFHSLTLYASLLSFGFRFGLISFFALLDLYILIFLCWICFCLFTFLNNNFYLIAVFINTLRQYIINKYIYIICIASTYGYVLY